MAAAEYFNPGGLQPNAYAGPSRPPMNMASTPPYPMSDAPPPYTSIAGDRPHSQPPPMQRPPPLDNYYQPPPNNQQYPPNGQQYPPEKSSRPPPQAQYRPQSYTQQPQQGYFSQPGPSSMPQSFNRDERRYSPNPGYGAVQQPHVHYRKESPRIRSRSRDRRDRDRDRSRSRSRSRHRRHNRPVVSQKSRSGVDTFIGAGGGALIGDAIFPGLGTIGGAILGGLGGHKVAKDKERRTHSNPNHMRGRSYSNDGDYYYADDYRRGRKY